MYCKTPILKFCLSKYEDLWIWSLEYGGINVIKSISPVDFNDVMSFFIQKKGATKMTLIPKLKLAIFDVSSANAIDQMM